MDILGIGIPELGFIILIAIIVLGPKDMQKAGKTIGKWMRKVVISPEWREIKNASRQMKQLPTQLMREANLEEFAAFNPDINVTMPKDKSKKLDNVDVDTAYGSWGGGTAHKKTEVPNNMAPPLDVELASAKSTSARPKASTAKEMSPIEKKDA